jgi:hypothetical protein
MNRQYFPTLGRISADFSNPWKIFGRFFQTLENGDQG